MRVERKGKRRRSRRDTAAASCGVGLNETRTYRAHIAVIERPLNTQPECGGSRRRQQARALGYQKMEQGVIGGGDPASKTGLSRSLTFTPHQVLGLLQQVVMKRHRVLLSSNLNERPTIAFIVNY